MSVKKPNKKPKQPFQKEEKCTKIAYLKIDGGGWSKFRGGGGDRPLHKYYGKKSEKGEKDMSKKFSVS